jgi:uncharacterized integral membrane protein
MMDTRHNPAKARLARKMARILHALGGFSWLEISATLVTALLLAVATNAFYDYLLGFFEQPKGVFGALAAVFGVLLLALLGIAKYLAGPAGDEVTPDTYVSDSPMVRVLVLFLSLPPERALPALTADEISEAAKDKGRGVTPPTAELKMRLEKFFAQNPGSLTDPLWLAAPPMKTFNWRMPFEAIAYQLRGANPVLERVIVIPSQDGKDRIGTHHFDGIFSKLVEVMLRKDHPGVRVERIADAADPVLKIVRRNQHSVLELVGGVPFHDMDAIYAALTSLFKQLQSDGYAPSDILIDATGGQVPTSIAAAVFTILSAQRRIQYIDTNTYEVLTFNVTHDAADLNLPQ